MNPPQWHIYPPVVSIKGIYFLAIIYGNSSCDWLLIYTWDCTDSSKPIIFASWCTRERDILHIPPRSILRSAYNAYLAFRALKKLCHDIWKRDLIQGTNPGFEIQSCDMCTELRTHPTWIWLWRGRGQNLVERRIYHRSAGSEDRTREVWNFFLRAVCLWQIFAVSRKPNDNVFTQQSNAAAANIGRSAAVFPPFFQANATLR